MARNIFVNLPVKDLEKTKEFFSKLGFTFNKQFSDDTAASMIVSDSIYVMLLTEPKFKGFINKEIVDAHTSTEVMIALDAESKDAVNEFMQKVLDAGGKQAREPYDYGFMYGQAFEDLDGHIWEIFWMDPAHVQPTE